MDGFVAEMVSVELVETTLEKQVLVAYQISHVYQTISSGGTRTLIPFPGRVLETRAYANSATEPVVYWTKLVCHTKWGRILFHCFSL